MSIQELLIQIKSQTQMTDEQIGQEIGAPQSIVTRLRNGTHRRTYHDRAQAIQQLAREHGIG